MGRSSPVAATRSAASVSSCTGRRPVRATAAPASAAIATPTPPIAGSAMPRRVSTARVASSRCPITSARPCPASTATTRYCTRPSVAVRTDDAASPRATASSSSPSGGAVAAPPADWASPFS